MRSDPPASPQATLKFQSLLLRRFFIAIVGAVTGALLTWTALLDAAAHISTHAHVLATHGLGQRIVLPGPDLHTCPPPAPTFDVTLQVISARLLRLGSSSACPRTSWAGILFDADTIHSEGVRSYSMYDIWVSKSLPSGGTLLPARNLSGHLTAPSGPIDWTPPLDHLLRIDGPTLVFDRGLVLTKCPLAVIDVSGGCCRKPLPFDARRPAPFAAVQHIHDRWAVPGQCDEPVSFAGKQTWREGWGRLLRRVDSYPEHDEIFLCLSARSSSYYHALGDTAPRLIYALAHLRAHPDVRIVAASSFTAEVLAALGISPARLLLFSLYDGHPTADSPTAFRARGLLVPPAIDHWSTAHLRPRGWGGGLLRAMRDAIVYSATRTSYAHAHAASDVVLAQRATSRVVRKKSGRRIVYPNRALLNHDEIERLLRRLFAPRRVRIFPPSGMPLLAQARMWRHAAFALSPHGAGLTNLIFMPPPPASSAGVLELRQAGHSGAVYHTLGGMARVRHEECIYNTSDAEGMDNVSMSLAGDANVRLPPAFLLRCLRDKYTHARGHEPSAGRAVDLFTPTVWARVETLLRGDQI